MRSAHIDVRVSLGRFASNVELLSQRVAPAELCVVLKADAYGHGLERLAPAAYDAGVDCVGICTNDEAWTIRKLGLPVRAVRLRMASATELEGGLDLDVEEQVGSLEAAEHLSVLASGRRERLPVHVNLDTGMGRSGFLPSPEGLRPVMSARTHVAQLRDVPVGTTIGYGSTFETTRPSRIAALPVGFGEGCPRALFNKGEVLVRGRRCPVVGRVSLNVTTIDVTDLGDAVRLGDEVVLVGRPGSDEITFYDMADRFQSVHTEMNLMAGRYNEIHNV